MKIIHTSDWHLGRRFGPVSLEADQQAFADWFVDLVADHHGDLVVIAGDLYDRAIAPTSAIDLFTDTVARLLDTGAVVAAISGNHDGPSRVAPYDDLMDRSGFYLRGGYRNAGEVIRHEFSDGPLDLVLIPYLDPQGAPTTTASRARIHTTPMRPSCWSDATAAHTSRSSRTRSQR
ncbi:MAG: exonuclease subunit SbcD [Microthrixaceae bacterium]|nr:exonuclease subunit SbcD [Microthrixaceae bacterium]